MVHTSRTWIEIDSQALQHNIGQVRALVGPGTALGAVLKSNAYGHGSEQIAAILQAEEEIAWLCTAGVAEALHLSSLLSTKKILVLSYLDACLEEALCRDIRLAVGDMHEISRIGATARRMRRIAYVHLKIDSGMQRRGIVDEQLASSISAIRAEENIVLEGIFTHLADTNNPDICAIQEPYAQFSQNARAAEEYAQQRLIKHIFASGAAWHRPGGDMVRLGTILYGLWKSDVHRQRCIAQLPTMTLQPVLSWKTYILQIKRVPNGSYIGYDRSFQATRDMIIAILPIGYADGYQRRFSNCGLVMVRERVAPIVGIVSMNLMAIDITHIPEAVCYDVVTLLGGSDYVSVTAQAGILQTNPLELLTALHPIIPRIITTKV